MAPAASPSLEVRDVRNGRGLVALRRFERGQRVCVLRGRLVHFDRLWSWWDRDPRRAANCIRFDADRYLDPHGELGAFANHSCRPNTMLVRAGRVLDVRAMRVIRPGDEVTHDYSTCLGADDTWSMRCNCGEPACRGRVRRFDRLPADVLQRYVRLGAIPAAILATANNT
jgi:hypothetical protein